MLRSQFFKYHLGLGRMSKCVVEVKGGSVELDVILPSNTALRFSYDLVLFPENNFPRNVSSDTDLNRFVMMPRKTLPTTEGKLLFEVMVDTSINYQFVRYLQCVL